MISEKKSAISSTSVMMSSTALWQPDFLVSQNTFKETTIACISNNNNNNNENLEDKTIYLPLFFQMVKVWLQRTPQFCISDVYMCVSNDSYSILYFNGNRKDTGKEEKIYVGQGWGKVLSAQPLNTTSVWEQQLAAVTFHQ